MKANLVTIFVGVCIALASWVPLLIEEVRDRHAMPVGLGLFAIAASFVGGGDHPSRVNSASDPLTGFLNPAATMTAAGMETDDCVRRPTYGLPT